MTRVLKWLEGAGLLLDAQLRWMFALALLSCGYAFAQEGLPDLGGDPLGWLRSMAGNPVALGLLVFGLVETWKRNAARREPPLNWQPWRWRTLAFVIGMGGSVLARVVVSLLPGGVPFTLADLPVALLNGALAGLVAIAGRDGLRTVLSWIFPGSAQASTGTQAADTGPAALPAGQGEGEVAGPPLSAFQAAEANRLMDGKVARGMEAEAALGLMGGLPTTFVGGLSGVAPAVLATLRALLGDELPEHLTAAEAAELALRLAPVLADLADGRPYLSVQSRNAVLEIVMDVKRGRPA